MARKRVDILLVEQGLAETRSKAQALVMAGSVLGPDGARFDKPGQLVAETLQLQLKGEILPYVSRGGLKLAKAIEAFDVDPRDQTCIDVGASTGGFTDVLLQHGAQRVYAVDVGYGQLHWRLRQDHRVVVLERTNIKSLTATEVPELCTLAVMDVSFISLTQVIPATLPFLAPEARLVALFKPQFEVGRDAVGKGGIVRDESVRQEALERMETQFAAWGLVDVQTCESPIRGAKGNVEFLIGSRYMPAW